MGYISGQKAETLLGLLERLSLACKKLHQEETSCLPFLEPALSALSPLSHAQGTSYRLEV